MSVFPSQAKLTSYRLQWHIFNKRLLIVLIIIIIIKSICVRDPEWDEIHHFRKYFPFTMIFVGIPVNRLMPLMVFPFCMICATRLAEHIAWQQRNHRVWYGRRLISPQHTASSFAIFKMYRLMPCIRVSRVSRDRQEWTSVDNNSPTPTTHQQFNYSFWNFNFGRQEISEFSTTPTHSYIWAHKCVHDWFCNK